MAGGESWSARKVQRRADLSSSLDFTNTTDFRAYPVAGPGPSARFWALWTPAHRRPAGSHVGRCARPCLLHQSSCQHSSASGPHPPTELVRFQGLHTAEHLCSFSDSKLSCSHLSAKPRGLDLSTLSLLPGVWVSVLSGRVLRGRHAASPVCKLGPPQCTGVYGLAYPGMPLN